MKEEKKPKTKPKNKAKPKTEKKKRGRKRKLDKKMIATIGELLEKGNYMNVVCNYVGISEATYYRWLDEGKTYKESEREIKDPDKLNLILLYETVQKATAKAEIGAVEGLLTHGDTQWQALAWFLERKYGQRWSLKQQIEHSGTLTNINKNIDLSSLSDEELEKELKKYE